VTTTAAPTALAGSATALHRAWRRFAAFVFTATIIGVELVWGLFLGYLVFSYVLPLFGGS
jgi:hypothetical protein